jgi:hypothetical protein
LAETGQYHSLGANFALWASGRVESIDGNDFTNTRYDAHWFGVKDDWSCDWRESWGDMWNIYSPYERNVANNPIGAVVLGLGTPAMETDASGHHSGLGAASNFAAPVRCIRQYDSTAGRTQTSK